MLDVALPFISDQCNAYLRTQGVDTALNFVTPSRLVDEAGKYAFQDTIAANVLNIEEERVSKSQLPSTTYTNGQQVSVEPDLKVNIMLMFAVNAKNYVDNLKLLSALLLFFQSHNKFTPDVYPSLDPRIEKLIFEYQTLTFDQLSQIWTFLGANQLPSIVYRVRLLVLQPVAPSVIQPPILTVNTTLRRQ